MEISVENLYVDTGLKGLKVYEWEVFVDFSYMYH